MKFLRISAAILMVIGVGMLRADVLAYATTGNQQFGVIDLTTGAYSNTGDMGQILSGLGAFGGGLYGGGGNGDVYQVNPATGALTAVITSGGPSSGWFDFGSTTTGLYGIDGTGVLYSVDPSTDVVTFIGSLGLSLSGTFGLSTGSGTLYFEQGGNLYQINTTTGAASLVGLTGISGIGGLVSSGGALYGVENTPSLSVVTVDTTNGAATGGPPVTNSNGDPLGLAQLPDPDPAVVPEPSFVALLAIGILGVGWAARKRRKLTA